MSTRDESSLGHRITKAVTAYHEWQRRIDAAPGSTDADKREEYREAFIDAIDSIISSFKLNKLKQGGRRDE